MDIDVTWLEDHILHCKLNDSDKDQLEGVIEPIVFSRGDTIMREGERGGALYLIRSGTATVSREIKGRQQRLRTVGEGALLGELTFLTGEPVTATVVADEKTIVYKMDRTGYSKLMQINQELVYALFTYILAYTSSMILQMNEDHAEILEYMKGIHK